MPLEEDEQGFWKIPLHLPLHFARNRYVYILIGQKFIKIVNLGEFWVIFNNCEIPGF